MLGLYFVSVMKQVMKVWMLRCRASKHVFMTRVRLSKLQAAKVVAGYVVEKKEAAAKLLQIEDFDVAWYLEEKQVPFIKLLEA